MIDHYVATPYSYPNHDVERQRYVAACRATAALMRAFPDRTFYCPVAASHGIAEHGELAGDWETWRRQDEAMMDVCGSIIVVMMPGWRESKGVRAEVAYMTARDKPVWTWNPAEHPIPVLHKADIEWPK